MSITSYLHFISLLIFISEIESNSDEKSINSQHFHHHIKGSTYRRRQPVCVNGKPIDGKCECAQDYVGRHCEKKKNCATFRRFRNGSCPICLHGYSGEFCEEINCVNGEPNQIGTECDCEEPYSGVFCDELNTNKVYGFYNKRVYWLGPLGALSLIPMCALYVGCEYMARKRQVKRVGQMLDGQNINVNQEILHHLLLNKVSNDA